MALPIVGRIASAAKISASKLVSSGSRGGRGRFVFGVGEQLARFTIFRKLTGEVWEKAAEDVANEILEEAKKRAPVETGQLRDSGHIQQIGEGHNARFAIGFSAPYALHVHEQIAMKLQGQKRRGSGRTGRYWDPQGIATARYLSRAIEENQSALKRKIIMGWGQGIRTGGF